MGKLNRFLEKLGIKFGAAQAKTVICRKERDGKYYAFYESDGGLKQKSYTPYATCEECKQAEGGSGCIE